MSQEQLQISQGSHSSSDASGSSTTDSRRQDLVTPSLSQTLSGPSQALPYPTFAQACHFVRLNTEELHPSHPFFGRLEDLLNDDGEHVVQAFYEDILKSCLQKQTWSSERRVTASKLDLDNIRIEGGRHWRGSRVHGALEYLLAPSNPAEAPVSTVSSGSPVTAVPTGSVSRSSSHVSSTVGLKAPDQMIIARMTLTEPQAARQSETGRVPPSPMKFCVPAMSFEYKPSEICMWTILCQTIAYASQIHDCCGAYLALMARHARFSRMVVLDEALVALEVSAQDQDRIRSQVTDDGVSPVTSHPLLQTLLSSTAPVRRLLAVKHLFIGKRSILPPNLLAFQASDLIPRCSSRELEKLYDYVEIAYNILSSMRSDQPLRPIEPLPDTELQSVLERLNHHGGLSIASLIDTEAIPRTLRKEKIAKRKDERWQDSKAKHRKSMEEHKDGTSRGLDQSPSSMDSTIPSSGQNENSVSSAESRWDDIHPEDSASQADYDPWDDLCESAVSDHNVLFLDPGQMNVLVDGIRAATAPLRPSSAVNDGSLGLQLSKDLTLQDQHSSSTDRDILG